jgi:hypothetical protein
MSVSPLPPRGHTPDPEPGMTVEQLRREVNDANDFAERSADLLEQRVAALEEIIAARWPRSIVLRLRLRRELRASVAGYTDLPPDFWHRRCEWHGNQVILVRMRFDERYRDGKQ